MHGHSGCTTVLVGVTPLGNGELVNALSSESEPSRAWTSAAVMANPEEDENSWYSFALYYSEATTSHAYLANLLTIEECWKIHEGAWRTKILEISTRLRWS